MNMKKYILEFIRRGLTALGLGPLVLAAIYLILHHHVGIEMLSADQVCREILSLSALAFVAGGMNVVYQIERLPLALAILIHGSVLYLSYLATYLLNGWLKSGTSPVLSFTVIFVLVYLMIWAVIFFVTKKNTARLNEKLKQKQQSVHKD